MTRKISKIGSRLKSKILQESSAPNCVISELAKSYNIAPQTLYSWRSELKSKNSSNIKLGFANSINISSLNASTSNKFVEVKCKQDINPIDHSDLSNSSSDNINILKKAILVFEDFSLSIEGKLNPKIISNIVFQLSSNNILEG